MRIISVFQVSNLLYLVNILRDVLHNVRAGIGSIIQEQCISDVSSCRNVMNHDGLKEDDYIKNFICFSINFILKIHCYRKIFQEEVNKTNTITTYK